MRVLVTIEKVGVTMNHLQCFMAQNLLLIFGRVTSGTGLSTGNLEIKVDDPAGIGEKTFFARVKIRKGSID